MAKTHKTITLCPNTRETAENMDNFSAFVRECLEAFAVGGSYAQMQRTQAIWMETARKIACEYANRGANGSETPDQIVTRNLIEARNEMKEAMK